MERRQENDLNRLQYVWPRAAVLQVIHLWREHACLYNPKHELYHSKRGRSDALVKMTNALRRNYPEITPFEVKNKINYLRGQYSRELSRIKEKSSADGEAYVPSVFWYSDLDFLEPFMRKKSTSKSDEHNNEQADDSCESVQKVEYEESSFQDCKRSRLGSYTPVSSRSLSQENPLLLPRNLAPLRKLPKSYFISDQEYVNERDEAFCNYIKMELNEIQNKNIKDELIEKITLAVFEAKKEQKLCNNDLEKCFDDL